MSDEPLEPIDLTGAPKALVFLKPGWDERLKALTPRIPLRPLTVAGEFSGTLYPGAAERMIEAIKAHPEYCNVCENFPCLGNHPPGEAAHERSTGA